MMKDLPADWNQDDQGLETLAAGQECPAPELVLAASAGVLPEPLQRQMERHLETCGLCRILSREMSDPELSNPTGAEKASILARVEEQVSPKRTGVWSWLWKPALGLAMATLALLVVLWNAPRTATQSAKQATPAPAPNIHANKSPDQRTPLPLEMAAVKLPLDAAIVWRGTGDDPGAGNGQKAYLSALGEALALYRSGKPAEAAEAFASVEARFPKGAEAPYYRGVSLLLAGQPAKAVPVLERARKLATPTLQSDVDWYLAVAYDRSDRQSDAAPLLRALCSQPGEHHIAACDGLKAIGR